MAQEIPLSEILAQADRFTKWNYQCPPDIPSATGYEPYLGEPGVSGLRKYNAVAYYQADEEGKKEIINYCADIYEKAGIFPIRYYSDYGAHLEISKVINTDVAFNGDTITTKSRAGSTLCSWMFPNLWKTPSSQDTDENGVPRSGYDKFYGGREGIYRMMHFVFEYNYLADKVLAEQGVDPLSVEKPNYPALNPIAGIRMTGSVPTNFLPLNAKGIYEHLVPKEGARIFDPACVDDETEFFTGTEWKSLAEYKRGDLVLQYNEDGTATLVEPIKYHHYVNGDPFYEYNGKSFNSCLTGDHRIIYRDRIDQTGELSEYVSEIPQIDIVDKDFRGRIPTGFIFSGDVEVPELLLRLLVAVQADGSIENLNTGMVKFAFTKPHKYQRLEALLSELNLPYKRNSITAGTKSGFDYRLRVPNLKDYFTDFSKTFPVSWYNLTEESKAVFLDEVMYWDSEVKERPDIIRNPYGSNFSFNYWSTNKANAELVLFLATSSNKSTFISEEHKPGYKVCYRVSVNAYPAHSAYRGHKNKYLRVYKKDKYCFTVDSGMLVLRRRGKVFITGNCGFSGRMVGALSSKYNYYYEGTDPNTETIYNLNRMGQLIESVTGRTDSYKLHCVGSEDFVGEPESFDFAFTSPPYFDLELYGSDGGDFNSEAQSHVRYPTLESWLEGYVRQTIKNINVMLKKRSTYAINIADFTLNGEQVNYVDAWAQISAEEGMPLIDNLYLGIQARTGSTLIRDSDFSKKKENILVFKKRRSA